MPDVPPPAGVLLIEDNAGIRTMLEVFLQQSGFTFWSAASGREGVTRLRENHDRIGVVLCDVQMHDWDGPKTLEEIRKLDGSLPVVFMTGASAGYSVNDLLALGAAKVLKKPFESLAVVSDILRGLLNRNP